MFCRFDYTFFLDSIEIEMDIATAMKVASSASSLSKFLTQGELLSVLQEFGEVQFESAIFSLKNANWANDPKREITLAVGHLQGAHIAFKRMYSGKNFFQRNFGYERIRNSIIYNQHSNLIMSLCYCYLDERELMQQSLNRSKDAFDDYRALDKDDDTAGPFISLLNPSTIKDLITDSAPSAPPLINKLDVDKLAYRLAEIF